MTRFQSHRQWTSHSIDQLFCPLHFDFHFALNSHFLCFLFLMSLHSRLFCHPLQCYDHCINCKFSFLLRHIFLFSWMLSSSTCSALLLFNNECSLFESSSFFHYVSIFWSFLSDFVFSFSWSSLVVFIRTCQSTWFQAQFLILGVWFMFF